METPKIKRILAAIDFSEMTGAVIDHALYLAKVFEAELKLLHVVHIPPFAEATTWLTPVISSSVEQDIRAQVYAGVDAKLNEIAQSCGDACEGVEALVRDGSPSDEIIICAREKEIDLIVLGTHGRTGLSHTIIGSVAERVVRLAPCSVFCINPSVIKRMEADQDEGG